MADKDKSEKDDAESEKDDGEKKAPEQPKTLEDALKVIERQNAALTDANREAMQRRLRLKELEESEAKRKADEEARRKAEMSEAERLKTEKAELEGKLKTQAEAVNRKLIVSELRSQAAQMFVDAGDVVSEYELGRLKDIAIKDDGTVEGVETALKELAKTKKHWLKASGNRTTDIDATRRGKGEQEISDEEAAQIASEFGVRHYPTKK